MLELNICVVEFELCCMVKRSEVYDEVCGGFFILVANKL